MTQSPKRHAVAVGLFIAGAVSILAAGILTIGDLNDTFTRRIAVSAVFGEVNGLQTGDNVWLSGVKVGIVKDLRFTDAGRVEVVMKVDVRAASHIHRDAQAKIGSNGLIGSTIVVLYGGTPTAPMLTEGDVLVASPTVSTEQILTMLHENGENLRAITTDLKEITRGLTAGEGTMGKLLRDDALHVSVARTAATLETTSVSTDALTSSLATYAAKLNTVGSLPHDLVTDRTSYPALQATVRDIQFAGKRTSDLVDGIAADVGGVDTPIGTLLHDPEVAADLKHTIDQLSRASVLLNDDLEALQHNIFLRGFFVQREAAAAKARVLKASQRAGAPETEP